jgi:hypothetical protein
MIVKFSNSSLKTLSTCTTKFILEYILGYGSECESAPARCGTDLHLGWSAYFRGFSTQTALRVFRDSYEDWTLDPQNYIEEKFAYENVAATFKQWLARQVAVRRRPGVSREDGRDACRRER